MLIQRRLHRLRFFLGQEEVFQCLKSLLYGVFPYRHRLTPDEPFSTLCRYSGGCRLSSRCRGLGWRQAYSEEQTHNQHMYSKAAM